MRNLCHFCHYHCGGPKEQFIKIAGSLLIAVALLTWSFAARADRAIEEEASLLGQLLLFFLIRWPGFLRLCGIPLRGCFTAGTLLFLLVLRFLLPDQLSLLLLQPPSHDIFPQMRNTARDPLFILCTQGFVLEQII